MMTLPYVIVVLIGLLSLCHANTNFDLIVYGATPAVCLPLFFFFLFSFFPFHLFTLLSDSMNHYPHDVDLIEILQYEEVEERVNNTPFFSSFFSTFILFLSFIK